MFNGGGLLSLDNNEPKDRYVKIIEQPAHKALRFRYECEARLSAGSLPGVSSTLKNKTFPTIQIVGYRGRAVVIVSCVTKDAPYRPHPHSLIGKEGCRRGVCTREVIDEAMSVTFSNLGIQCVKKNGIESALKQREEIRVDPFKTGFSHRRKPASINLRAVRLCFQVFLEGDRGKFTIPLKPIVSQPIYDSRDTDLMIVELSHCVASVDGGKNKIILLCRRVSKDDINIRFYEEQDDRLVWEAFGDFKPSQVHYGTAISFKPPRYKNLNVTEPVSAFIQLRRPSDGATSEPLQFQFLPLDSVTRTRNKVPNLNVPDFDAIRNGSIGKSWPYNTSGLSPIYVPNETVPHQFHYRLPTDPLGLTPPPFFNIPPNNSFTIQPVLNDTVPQHWNINNDENAINEQNDLSGCGSRNNAMSIDIDTPSGLSGLLDEVVELKPLNSADLAPLSMMDDLSENLSNNLSLNDVSEPL